MGRRPANQSCGFIPWTAHPLAQIVLEEMKALKEKGFNTSRSGSKNILEEMKTPKRKGA
jgi:hypothetical protein